MSVPLHEARAGHTGAMASTDDHLRSILAQAEAWLATMAPKDHVETSSPVCYVDEVSGAYAGHLSERELAHELGTLAGDLRRALLALLTMQPEPRPFPDRAVGLARALVLTERLAASQHIALPRPAGDGTPDASQLPLVRAAALGRLRSVIPRVPDRVRDVLSDVVALVDIDEPKAVTTGHESPPDRHSTGSHAASDR